MEHNQELISVVEICRLANENDLRIGGRVHEYIGPHASDVIAEALKVIKDKKPACTIAGVEYYDTRIFNTRWFGLYLFGGIHSSVRRR